ncbi:MAG TPA: hypothetical protein VEU96_27140 [Bryobacteraceae bacterium]|nr:hypothetical protein [Bryobacteraceae bacterium]
MRARRIVFGLGLWICCSSIACAGGAKVDVELDAFSGRPNPKWTLSADKASRILKQIASLPETNDTLHIPDLGFRGFVLRSGGRSIRVFGGLVTIESAGVTKAHRDTAGILKDLTEDARKRGFEAVVGDSAKH